MLGMVKRPSKGMGQRPSSQPAHKRGNARPEPSGQASPTHGEMFRFLARDPTSSLANWRQGTEDRLSAFLKRTNGSTTLGDIRNVILHEVPSRHPSEYFVDIIALFPATVDIDVLLPIIQDAWNYFPHLSLNGRCPAELMHQNVGHARVRRRTTSG
jgi:hypothetical protein